MQNKTKILACLSAVLAAGTGISFFGMNGNNPSGLYLEQAAAAQEAQADLVVGAERLSQAFRASAAVLRPSVVTITAKVDVNQRMQMRRGQRVPFDLPPQFRGLIPEELFEELEMERGQELPPADAPLKPSESKPVKMGVGSGVIVSTDGFILTNNHVVSKADELEVRLSDNRSFRAKIIGNDDQCDLALLKIDAQGLVAARLGDSSKMDVGDWVIAIGSPFELDQTVTAGIISAVNRFTDSQILPYEDFLQTDAAINPGNSGGPLVNLRGEVVGINTAINSRTGTNAGVGFAIPSNTAAWVMTDLKDHGKVRRGFIGAGLRDVSYDELRQLNLPADVVDGVGIAFVHEGGPASKAKVQEGDIVVRANGRQVNSVAALRNVVAMVRPGNAVDLDIYRQGKPMRISVTVEEQTKDKLAAMSGQTNVNELGIVVEALTPDLAEQLEVAPNTVGVVVLQVDSRGRAASMRLRPGDVITQINGQDISTPADLKKALANNPNRLMMVITRGPDEIILRSINSAR